MCVNVLATIPQVIHRVKYVDRNKSSANEGLSTTLLYKLYFSTNRLDEHVVERSDLPDHLIKDVPGDVLLEQVDVRVSTTCYNNDFIMLSFASMLFAEST